MTFDNWGGYKFHTMKLVLCTSTLVLILTCEKIKCMYGKGGYLSVDIIFNLHNWLVV
jgi:hypothetical protein